MTGVAERRSKYIDADLRAGEFDLTAADVVAALPAPIGEHTLHQWRRKGLLPGTYWWRAPSGRVFFKHKLISWLCAESGLARSRNGTG